MFDIINMDHFVVAGHVLGFVLAEWMMSRQICMIFVMMNIENESEIQNSD